jgi:hypothetical protein
MSLLCPDCTNVEDDDSPYCCRCGTNLVRSLRHRNVVVGAQRREVVVDRYRVNCICYGERLTFDPLDEQMSSRFQCSKFPGRIDCVACPVCSGCGQVKCTCRFLGINIGVKIKGTVIETVPVRARLG